MNDKTKTDVLLTKVNPDDPKPAVDAMMKFIEEKIAAAESRRNTSQKK